MKAQRRSRAEAIATNRMLLDVPKADVVIVNPTHYAVALKWSRAPGQRAGLRRQGRGRGGAAHPRGGRRPPACRCTATRRPPGRCTPRSRSAARSRPSTIAPSPRRSASPTGCAAPPASGGRHDAGRAAPARRAGRGAQGARPGAARRRCCAEDRRLAAEIAAPRRHRRARPRARAPGCRWRSRACGRPGPTSTSGRLRRRRAELAAGIRDRPRRGGAEPRQAPRARGAGRARRPRRAGESAPPAPSARRRRPGPAARISTSPAEAGQLQKCDMSSEFLKAAWQ